MRWFKKEKTIIEFSCKEWAIRKYAPVMPASSFMPQAYKDIPAGTICPFDPFHKASLLSIKLCPALNQYQSAGYVIPAWADMEITFDDNGGYSVNVSNPDYPALSHNEEQYPGLLENRFKFRTTLKFLSPWSVKTAPGYSLMWLPMFFHDVNYQAVPAILDSDILPNEMPINMMFFERKTTFIKMGDPLVHIIPFKRIDVTGISREYNDADRKRWKSLHGLRLLTKISWRPFIKNKLKFTLDRKDTELE